MDNKKTIFICGIVGFVLGALIFFFAPGIFGNKSNDSSVSTVSDISEASDSSETTALSSSDETKAEISDSSEYSADSGISEEAGLSFRSNKLLKQHYEKHGIEMGFDSAEEYEKAAAAVVSDPRALHKTEAEDGDDVYYIEETNEFVIVSVDGYIRTYFNPNDGLAYYNRQ